MNIRTKILVIFLLTSIPAIGIVGVINYDNAKSKITHDVLEKLDGIASIQEKRVEESIDRNFERLDGITSRTQLRISLEQFNQNGNAEDAEKIQEIIKDAKDSIGDIDTVFIINTSGEVIFSTEESILGKTMSAEKMFVDGYTKNTLTFGTNILDNSPEICISGPLILNGNTIGVLVIKVDPRTILEISSDYTALGDTGETFLAMRDNNGDAMFITSLRFDENAIANRVILKEQIEVPITQALMKNEDTHLSTVDYRGEPVLAATRYIEITDWGLAVKIDKDEAFSTINSIRDMTLISLGVVIIATISGSVFFSKAFTKRIRKLSTAAKEIADGELTTNVTLTGNDEISQLSKDIQTMENTLRENKVKLLNETRFAAIGELASRIAHDLRNPLSVVKNSLELMEYARRDVLSEHEKRQFAMMNRAVERMERQITEVLDFVRNREIKMEEADLLDLLNLSVSSFDIPPDVKLSLPNSGVSIPVDTIQIQAVFSNLIQNALHAVGREGEISINFEKDNDSVRITIQDSGKGIPQESMEKIFEPLFTTKQTGTGLGLASCKNIIEKHGGTISVSNNPTTFTITLPFGIKISEKS
ncbi:MAG: HAMP domain-containing protein [Crenarchaeota archaeon]|nr:MAG: HAMP domain-containing protein [Thermoproteota archaeon]RDJ33616.1 MAG: HAMP domain-containing protein [Thermoproteota archaeon]RDJ38062.1 MAG: HAMP domain-containing protein [Thermoproteota archaeon]RDJ39169.1 MAG: HAMP domain-containing protein [Thermoproteota archaeon]